MCVSKGGEWVPNEVYADLLFLVNFSMDFLGFYLTARLLHRPLSLWRGVLASALGGVYAVAVLFLTVGRVPAFLIDLAVCFALCAIALVGRREGLRSCLRLGGLYLLVSVVLGGAMTLLYAQLNRIPGLTDRVEEDGLSAWLFLVLAVASAVMTSLWGRSFRRTTTRREVGLVIEHGGQTVRLRAFCDSGNLLRDPISAKPVVVVEADCLRPLVPAALCRAADGAALPQAVAALPSEAASNFRLIPAKTAAGEGLLVGFLPDHIYVRENDAKEAREISALVALTKLNEKAGIEALLPGELMIS